MLSLRNKPAVNKTFCRNWSLGVVTILFIELFFYLTGSGLRALSLEVTRLPVPLSLFPERIGDWSSEEIAIPEFVQQASGNDDFVYRLFRHEFTGQWVTLYLAYSARPRTMLGHRPEICYVADGWVHENSIKWDFFSSTSRSIKCSVHRFYNQTLEYSESVVLNFYILNGQISRDESKFSSIRWRGPNLSRDPSYYVAQVQIRSEFENSVQSAARDMTDVILDFFPDENGEVKAREYIQTAGAML